MKIEFSCAPAWEGVFAEPYKAQVPSWIKSMPHDTPQDDGDYSTPVGTIKRCMPVFDVCTTGWVIPLPAAMRVVAFEDGSETMHWPVEGWQLISSHGEGQAPPYAPAYKLNNPWFIRTDPGWSSLFIPPTHHPLPFRVFPAIVDTDLYDDHVNFPFNWIEHPFDKTLQAGMPFVQVIPVWRGEIEGTVRTQTQDEANAIARAGKSTLARQHRYKAEVRASRTRKTETDNER